MILMSILVVDEDANIQSVYNFDATSTNIDTKIISEVKEVVSDYLCVDGGIDIDKYSIFGKWLKLLHTDSNGKISFITVTWSHINN